MMRTLLMKVAGVSYEGRQEYIALLSGGEPCQFKPEPENPYDPNAIAILVASRHGVRHVGYVPRELAAEIAPHLGGESLIGSVAEVTGGFALSSGDRAAYGLRVLVEIPDEAELTST